MNVRKSAVLLSFVLLILTCCIDIEAAKASRSRSGSKTKSPSRTPNRDHYALSYGGSHGHQNTHQTVHQPVQQHSSSAPALPTNNKQNIGWNLPQHHGAEQTKTVSNSQSALPYPNNPPPYTQHATHSAHPPAGPPPPYSQQPNSGFQSNAPAGPPPPYSQNTPYHSNNGQQQPVYQPNAPSYPMHNTAGANYPQQQYNPSGVASGGFVPNNQPAPVINNFYGQPQSGGSSSGGGFLQTALAAGAGSLAGNALYGALKPSDSEHKTVIIHENAASAPATAQAPAPAPVNLAPFPTNPAPVGETPSAQASVPGSQPIAQQPTAQQPVDGQTTMQQTPQTEMRSAVSSDANMPLSTNVPLAQSPDVTNQTIVPLSQSTNAAPTTIGETNVNQTSTAATMNVPLAPFPSNDPSAHAQKGSANTFVIFNISVYTVISLIIANTI